MAYNAKLEATINDVTTVDVCFSILSFHSEERTLSLLSSFVPLVKNITTKYSITYQIIVRDNSPANSKLLDLTVRSLMEEGYAIKLFSGPNLGFGAGHNFNFSKSNARVFCVMNNDMTFPHVDWLPNVISRLHEDQTLGAIGLDEEKYALNEFFGFANKSFDHSERLYLDGSLLFIRSDVYRQMNGFDETFGLAYFEDSDFSLRLRCLGFGLGTQDMPHQHFRSSSTVNFAPSFYSSIYEKGRSVFFNRWGEYLERGLLNNRILISCDHDGIGDFFLGLYPMRSFIKSMQAKGFQCVLQLRHKDLAFLLSDIVGLEIIFSAPATKGSFVRRIRMAAPNMALPVLATDLYSAMLGELDFPEAPGDLQTLLRPLADIEAAQPFAGKSYAVCHFEELRKGFAGRTLPFDRAAEVLAHLAVKGLNIVLIGGTSATEAGSIFDMVIKTSRTIHDVRGKTTLRELISIIANADLFFGADSGPANIAQTFGIPGLVVFGAISPNTRIYRPNMKTFVGRHVTCTGCYHANVEYAYNTCFRDDEACVKEIVSEDLLEAVDDVVQNHGQSYVADATALRLRQIHRDHVLQLMYNPVHRSKLYSLNGFIGKTFADAFQEIVDVVGRRAVHHANDMKEKLTATDVEMRELRRQLEEAENALSLAAAIRNRKGGTDISGLTARAEQTTAMVASATKSRAGHSEIDLARVWPQSTNLVECSAKVAGDTAIVLSEGQDPNILLRPIDVTGSSLTVMFQVEADAETQFRIYWAINSTTFAQENSVGFPVGSTAAVFKFHAPVKTGDRVFLRLDPAERSCTVKFSVEFFGAARVGSSNKVRFHLPRLFTK